MRRLNDLPPDRYCDVRKVQQEDVYLDVRILQLLRIMLHDMILEAGPNLRMTNPQKFRRSVPTHVYGIPTTELALTGLL